MSNTPDNAADAVLALELEEVVRKRVEAIVGPLIVRTLVREVTPYNTYLKVVVRGHIREYMRDYLATQSGNSHTLPY